MTEPVDGNAIAGELRAQFGREMTSAEGACAHCGARSMIAELTVFDRAPGSVLRCRHCGQVVIVVVTIRGERSAYLDGFRLHEPGQP